jgi:hypothetical protein
MEGLNNPTKAESLMASWGLRHSPEKGHGDGEQRGARSRAGHFGQMCRLCLPIFNLPTPEGIVNARESSLSVDESRLLPYSRRR